MKPVIILAILLAVCGFAQQANAGESKKINRLEKTIIDLQDQIYTLELRIMILELAAQHKPVVEYAPEMDNMRPMPKVFLVPINYTETN